MSLLVKAAGACSLLVDGGRPSSRGLGVPVGGPADRQSLAIGNAFVGNPPATTALEIALSGPTLVADTDVGMCLFGATFQTEIDGRRIEANGTFTLFRGQTLRIGGASAGCRAYLCVPGGFTAPRILGSTSALEPLHIDNQLNCASSRLPVRSLAEAPPFHALELRYIVGPQAGWFKESLDKNIYSVAAASNRMGLRLEGPKLKTPKRNMISEPVAPGAVQITNEGLPIVLGVDGQTIGGYPKIAHVIEADLDILGQLRPGDRLRLRRVSESNAERAARDRRDALVKLLRRIALS